MMGNPTCSGPPIGIQRFFVAGGRRVEANIATCFSSSQRKRRKFDEKARFGAHVFRLRMPRSQSRKSRKSYVISRAIPRTKARTSPSAMARVGPLESQTTSRACCSSWLELSTAFSFKQRPTSRHPHLAGHAHRALTGEIHRGGPIGFSLQNRGFQLSRSDDVGGWRVLSKSAPRTTSAALAIGSAQNPSCFSPVGSIQPSARRSDTTSAH